MGADDGKIRLIDSKGADKAFDGMSESRSRLNRGWPKRSRVVVASAYWSWARSRAARRVRNAVRRDPKAGVGRDGVAAGVGVGEPSYSTVEAKWGGDRSFEPMGSGSLEGTGGCNGCGGWCWRLFCPPVLAGERDPRGLLLGVGLRQPLAHDVRPVEGLPGAGGLDLSAQLGRLGPPALHDVALRAPEVVDEVPERTGHLLLVQEPERAAVALEGLACALLGLGRAGRALAAPPSPRVGDRLRALLRVGGRVLAQRAVASSVHAVIPPCRHVGGSQAARRAGKGSRC